MSSGVLSRRYKANMEDEEELVENEQSASNSAYSNNTPDSPSSTSSSPLPSLSEENHIRPPGRENPVKALKRKLATSSSPKGKYVLWWVAVIILGLLALLLVAIPLILEQGEREDCSDFEEVSAGEDYKDFPFLYFGDSGNFELCQQGRSVLSARLGVYHDFIRETRVDVYAHSANSSLNITRHPGRSNNCLRIEWVGISSMERPLTDCYEIGDAKWFAAYEQFRQQWPLDANASLSMSPFLPHDFFEDTVAGNSFGSVLHPLWLSSNGVGILVDEGVQLYVTVDENRLCLHAQPFELECAPLALDMTHLNYTVCTFESLAEVSQYFLAEHIRHPRRVPSSGIFQSPIWSTWPHLSSVDQSSLSAYVSAIHSNNLPISQLAVNESYSRPGLQLSSISSLEKSMAVAAWLHPLISYHDPEFDEGLSQGSFLPGASDGSVTLVKWWNQYGAILNTLNENVTEEYGQQFRNFVNQNNLDTVKFDAGQYTTLPKCVLIEGLGHPGNFSKHYVQFVANISQPSFAEVRIGFFTQDEPVLIHLLDRRDTKNNILQTILNTVLAVGLGGYPFTVPSVVGGVDSSVITKELYVRWMQLSTFLPIMHISRPPWNFSDISVVEHTRMLTSLHRNLSTEFIRLAQISLDSGYPIIRPLWWIAVRDHAALSISDQFLIGDRIMVAPVLNGVASATRSVYFPRGTSWQVVSPERARQNCEQHRCEDGSTATFTLGMFEVLYFNRTQ